MTTCALDFSHLQYIRDVLDELGVPYEYPIATTGIVGIIRGTLRDQDQDQDHSSDDEPVGDVDPWPVITLRADMDALPITEPQNGPTTTTFRSQHEGVMHACGHDSHVAMLLGAAKLLVEKRALFGGEVRLVFQPAEVRRRTDGWMPRTRTGFILFIRRGLYWVWFRR